MSRNNLLLSLLANNPNSRSNSSANKQGLSPSMSFYPRSTSNSLSKVQKTQTNKIQTSTHLIKLFHMLNIKVKQTYYFAFCRLQQLHKAKNPKQSQHSQSVAAKTMQNCQVNKQKIQDQQAVTQSNIQSFKDKDQAKKTCIIEGFAKLSDCYSSLITKMKVKQENIELKNSFKRIKNNSAKYMFIQKLQRIFDKQKKSTYQQFFNNYSYLQHLKIKLQILFDSLSYYTKKIMLSHFLIIKSCEPKPKYQPDSFTYSQHNYQTNPQPIFIQAASIDSTLTEIPNQQPIQAASEKTSRCIKIKMKQKNAASITKPLKLQQIAKSMKALKYNVKQPSTLIISPSIVQNNNQNKSVLINLQHEHFNNQLPDFADNCSIFRNLPEMLQTTLSKKTHFLTQIHHAIQPRKSVQMLPTEDGSLTDRTKFCEPLAQSNLQKQIPSKYNSLGKLKGKKIISVDQSPLKKVEQLFKSVQQSISTTNKQKKFININLPKFFNSQSSKINTSKTPLKQLHQQINISHSKGKQHATTRQRLLTERDKQKLEQGGLQQSGGKYKSSMLVRQKKVKADKIQLSTARKMKMEIQNIISRRNKQLGMKNQLYQLK